jgi:hypothetical protein
MLPASHGARSLSGDDVSDATGTAAAALFAANVGVGWLNYLAAIAIASAGRLASSSCSVLMVE